MRQWICTISIFLSAAFGTAVLAQPGLLGGNVSFQVITYDDPAQPLFEGAVHTARITETVEFGLKYEGIQNDLDVVPILIDIGAARIEIDYSTAEPGALWKAAFNGYVLTFDAPCPTITRAKVDPAGTNLPFDNKRVQIDGNSLRLNVSNLTYNRKSRIAVDLSVTECPSS